MRYADQNNCNAQNLLGSIYNSEKYSMKSIIYCLLQIKTIITFNFILVLYIRRIQSDSLS